jgi:hypothetical protein
MAEPEEEAEVSIVEEEELELLGLTGGFWEASFRRFRKKVTKKMRKATDEKINFF